MNNEQDLREYLADPDFAMRIPFTEDEINEPIITSYSILQWAIRDNCTVIEISARKVQWLKNEYDKESVDQLNTPIDFIPIFEAIICQDEIIKKCLKIMERTEEKVILKISC